MPISWNEIRHNAVAFAKDRAGVSREDAEAKTFWDEFFKVFGIKRRTVASFEEPVKNLSGNWSYIDLFWKATLLVEHKSRGKLPLCNDDGYLPPGIHPATLEEIS